MKFALVGFATVAVAFLALDAVWLTLTAETLYRRHLGAILLDGFRLMPAILFYVLYMIGIVAFALEPSRGGGVVGAILRGALLGLVAYGTYDLTNQATMKVWSTTITLADLAWGTIATATAAAIGHLVTAHFTPGTPI